MMRYVSDLRLCGCCVIGAWMVRMRVGVSRRVRAWKSEVETRDKSEGEVRASTRYEPRMRARQE